MNNLENTIFTIAIFLIGLGIGGLAGWFYTSEYYKNKLNQKEEVNK